MKDRFAKFYQKHEDKISLLSTVSGIAAGFAGVYLIIADRGHHVARVFDIPDFDNGNTIFVELKNGSLLPFTKPEK